jgi:AcrR family transcriptional regulator
MSTEVLSKTPKGPDATVETAANVPDDKPLAPRERILKVAGGLFYNEGYRAVGIDKVIAQSDVAKATFYKHFPSKDDLIVAWIERASGFGDAMERETAKAGGPPLLSVFDAYVDIALRAECMGCTFQGTAAEFPDLTHPAHAASLKVKSGVIERFTRLASQQGVGEPGKIAEMLFLLLEGVWASVRMYRQQAPLAHAKEAARRLIRA